MSANVANQKELFGEGFKGDKTFLLIILLAKWVYQLVFINKVLRGYNKTKVYCFEETKFWFHLCRIETKTNLIYFLELEP